MKEVELRSRQVPGGEWGSGVPTSQEEPLVGILPWPGEDGYLELLRCFGHPTLCFQKAGLTLLPTSGPKQDPPTHSLTNTSFIGDDTV